MALMVALSVRRLLVGLLVAAALAEPERDTGPLLLGEPLKEGEGESRGEAEWLAVTLLLRETEGECVCRAVLEGEAVPQRVALLPPEGVGRGLVEGLAVAEAWPEDVLEMMALRVTEGEAEAERETDTVPLLLRVGLTLADSEGEAEAQAVAKAERETEGEAEAEREVETLPVPLEDREGEELGVTDMVAVLVGRGVRVVVREALLDLETDTLEDWDTEPEALSEGRPDTEGEALAESDRGAVGPVETLRTMLAVALAEREGVLVEVGEALRVAEGVVEAV